MHLKPLLAGTGRADITPAPGTPQGGWGAQTHQRGVAADMPFYATALALAQGEERVVIVDADAIGFDDTWTARILDAIAALTGLERARIRFSCTHTHSGPNTFRPDNIGEGRDMAQSYLESLPHRIAGAAWQAFRNLQPVRVGAALGECGINVNRRVHLPDGRTVVGQNPGAPADRSLRVLRLDRLDRTPLAVVMHYACHGTTIAWQSEHFTPDYPGPARETVERQFGCRCLFLQGAAGDLGPRQGFTGDLAVYRQLGTELGLHAAALAASIDTLPVTERLSGVMPSGANIALYESLPCEPAVPRLRVLSREMALPLRTFRLLEELEAEERALRAEAADHRRAGDMEAFRLANALATQAGWRTGNARKYQGMESVSWPLQVIRIGPIALASVAGEPFSAIGRLIVAESPFTHTLFSGYSNGGFGYIPDESAFREGGYEVEATPFRAEAAGVVAKEVAAALRELVREDDGEAER